MKKTIKLNFLTRVATLLLLTVITATTAWAQENTTFPLTSGQTWTNTTTNTKYTVSGEAGNLTLTASVADPNVNDGTATIADDAFYYKDMSGVKTFAIGDGITSIGARVFMGAENVGISAITIGKDVTSIGKNAFEEITSSHTITFAANSQLTTIGENAFYHSSGLTSINLGDCLLLESIAINAFSTCTGLTTLDLSTCTNLATIENFAFFSCTNLTITILYSLNYGQYTFNGVHQLNRVSPTIDGLTFNETDGCFDIGTLTEFQTFLTYANNVSGTSQCQGLTFRLTADIDMTGQTYMPVGNFSGTFDGNSHAITGLSGSNGLFALVGPGGSVTGLTLSGVNISGGSQVGAVVGNCNGVIENCHVTGTVSGASAVGGIVGYELQPGLGYTNNPHVSGCTFSGTVTGTDYVGGIVGLTTRQIQDCTVTGSTISGRANVGGIAGFILGANEGTTDYDITGCTVAGVSVSVAAGNEGYRGKVCGHVDPEITTDPEEIATIVHDNNVYYSVTCGTGITAAYVSGDKMNVGGTDYYATGATFTIGHTDREGYIYVNRTTHGTAELLGGDEIAVKESDVVVDGIWYNLFLFGYNDDPLVDGSAEHPYVISNADGWEQFCDCLDDNDMWNRFSGKTVKLANDITVSRMAGSQYHDFCGTFDGNGKTLTFNYGSPDTPANVQYIAPFHYVSTVTPEGGSEVPANFRNLHVAGDIYTSAKYAAGLIAQHWGTVNVENCRSSIVIHSSVSGDGTHGGFEAESKGGLNITGCVFDGKLLTTGTTATTNCGGFVGYGSLNVSNSLYAPAALDEGETEITSGSATFVRNSSAGSNCYYTRTLGTAQGKQARSITAGENVTVGFSGTATEYNVSGITAYTTGIQYNNVLYAGSGDAVSLTLSHTDRPGYTFSGYEASAGTLSGTTLTMPDADVIIAALWETPGITLPIGTSGWATWYDTKSYTLSSGATAYYVSSVADGTVNLTAIEGGVPAGVPVLINGSGTVTLTAAATATEVTGNDEQFKGTATELTATDFTDFTDGRTYVLYGGKFMLAEQNGGIGAHKCWLTLTAPTTARQLNISVEGATNLYPSIIAADESTQEGGWYDLQGRKLSGEPTKQGIYIFKGKKVKR